MRRSASIATWRRAGQTKWLRNAFHNRRRTTRFLDSSPHSTSIAIGVSYSTNTISSYAKGTLELEKPTIYALSTAPGRAGIAIIRISGPACRSVSLCLESQINLLKVRRFITDYVLTEKYLKIDVLLSAVCTTQQSLHQLILSWIETLSYSVLIILPQ